MSSEATGADLGQALGRSVRPQDAGMFGGGAPPRRTRAAPDGRVALSKLSRGHRRAAVHAAACAELSLLTGRAGSPLPGCESRCQEATIGP